MKKLSLAIVAGTTLVTLSVLPIVGTSCKWVEPSPPSFQMTAVEVNQYVNQALPSEYVPHPQYRGIRYELRYTAVSARHFHEVLRVWKVSVKVIAEPQGLSEGQWAATPRFETTTSIQQYYFSEITGAVTR